MGSLWRVSDHEELSGGLLTGSDGVYSRSNLIIIQYGKIAEDFKMLSIKWVMSITD